MYRSFNLITKKKDGVSVLDSILESRGIVDRESFFNPETKPLSSPYVFSDMKKAVDIIKKAIENGDKILIWGDFDADGVTSTSILYKTFSFLGAQFSYFLPDRANMGHGLNLKELLKQKSKNGIKVLITVDCGISSGKEIELLKTMGVKTVVTDHHEPPEILPPADCILNPLAKNSLTADLTVDTIKSVSYMSGAGVALKLACALLDSFDNSAEIQNVKGEILALAAIGTISDVVPLTGENRIITARGLVEINNGKLAGVKKLFSKQNFEGKIKSEDIAFILTPRINAAGRLSTPMESIRLLIEENDFALDGVIERLDSLNKIRQSLCDKIFAEALLQSEKHKDCIVLYNPEWHLGIIGIVASRLVEKFNVPVFLVTKDDKDIYRASIRGTAAYDIAKILQSLKDSFLGFGGHAMAGGFSADMNSISFDELKKRIEEAVSNHKDESKIKNSIDIDIELEGGDIDFDLVEEIDKMEPFGANNTKPLFLFKGAKLIHSRSIGKENNHMAFSVVKDSKEFNCLYWRRQVLGFEAGENIDLVFKPDINVFNDEKKIQLIAECILNDKLEDSFSSKIKIFDHRQKTGILDKINEYAANKNGAVKILLTTLEGKKSVEKYPYIVKNIIKEPYEPQKSLMIFDYPPNLEAFREIIKDVSPGALHLMKPEFSKNPDKSISTICGMVKYATNNKDGEIQIKTIANSTGLDEVCVQSALELLEKIQSVRIDDIDKIIFIKPPSIEALHGDSTYELYKDEFDRVIEFKSYLACADIDTLEELCMRQN